MPSAKKAKEGRGVVQQETYGDLILRLKATASDSERKARMLRSSIKALENNPELFEIIRFLTDPGYRYE
jgi:hypothetical protein